MVFNKMDFVDKIVCDDEVYGLSVKFGDGVFELEVCIEEIVVD